MLLIRKKWNEIIKTDIRFQKAKELGESFQTSTPAPFVGRYGYPNISVGILCPPETGEENWKYDAPQYWAGQNFKIPQIIGYRAALVNTQTTTNIKKPLRHAQLTAMAAKPVDIEVKLKKKIRWNEETDGITAPTGPRAELEKVTITSNPKIPHKVEEITNDEIKATEAVQELYEAGFDENYLSKLLSVGTLGIDKKLVPTRWSITATDDIITKQLLEEIKEYPETEYTTYYGNYLGNYYLILMMQDKWQYELFEMSLPAKEIMEVSTDYEEYSGRKKYAENCTGGYYSVRLAITEKLKQLKKQASCLVFRFVTQEYDTPLGVWVTREATRKALNEKPIKFNSKQEMTNYAIEMIKQQHNMDITQLLQESKIMKEKQLRLNIF